MNPGEFTIIVKLDGTIVSKDSVGNTVEYSQSVLSILSTVTDIMNEHSKTLRYKDLKADLLGKELGLNYIKPE